MDEQVYDSVHMSNYHKYTVSIRLNTWICYRFHVKMQLFYTGILSPHQKVLGLKNVEDHLMILYLYILLLYWFLRAVVNIHRPSVVVLQRWSDHYVIEAVQVEVRDGSDGGTEACAAGLVLTDALTVALGVSRTAGLIHRLQRHLVFKQPVLRSNNQTHDMNAWDCRSQCGLQTGGWRYG